MCGSRRSDDKYRLKFHKVSTDDCGREHAPCRKPSAGTAEKPARVRTCTTEIQAGDGRVVSCEPEHRPHRIQLIDRQLPVKYVSSRKTVVGVEVHRSDELVGDD